MAEPAKFRRRNVSVPANLYLRKKGACDSMSHLGLEAAQTAHSSNAAVTKTDLAHKISGRNCLGLPAHH